MPDDLSNPPRTHLPTPLGYSCEYVVKTYDIENRRRMTVAALVKLMQEAAMRNVMALKVSAWDLQPLGITWVLLRKHLKINRLPLVDEKVEVDTYPAGFEKFFTYRDYKIYDQADELIASSSTTWLLLDMVERRMARIPDFILEFGSQMPAPEDCLPRPAARLPVLDKPETTLPFRVNWHDLDFNGHLNNVFYLQWMLEALPDEALLNGSLAEMEIHYKVEAHWKEELTSEVQQVDGQRFLHRLVRKLDGKEMAVGVSRFENFPSQVTG